MILARAKKLKDAPELIDQGVQATNIRLARRHAH